MIFLEEPENFTSRFEVAGCFVEHDGRILLLKRHSNKPEGGTWCGPSGKLDEDETADAAIIRETKEETGLILDPPRLEHVKKIFVVYPDYQFIYHIFRIKIDSFPTVTISHNEHTEYTWVTPEEALDMDLIQDEDECIRLTYGI